MGQSTEELSAGIADTRRSLASDLDALQDRVSPSAIVGRRTQAARGRVRSVRDRVMGTAHDVYENAAGGASSARESARGTVQDAASTAQDTYEGAPLAAGLAAFGAGMVLASLLPASEREAVAAGRAVDAAKQRARPLLEEAKDETQQIARQAGEQAQHAAEEVRRTATEGAERVTAEGRSAAESVREDAPGG